MNLAIMSTFLVAIMQIGTTAPTPIPTGSEPILSRVEQVDITQNVSCYDLNPSNSAYLVSTELPKIGSTMDVLYFGAPCRSDIAPMVGYLALSLARPDKHIKNVPLVLEFILSKLKLNAESANPMPLDALLNAPGDSNSFSLLDYLENKLDTGGLCNDCKLATLELMQMLRSYGAHTREERILLNQSKWDQ